MRAYELESTPVNFSLTSGVCEREPVSGQSLKLPPQLYPYCNTCCDRLGWTESLPTKMHVKIHVTLPWCARIHQHVGYPRIKEVGGGSYHRLP